MKPGTIEILATSLFALSILHTFLVSRFQHLASQHPEGSIKENLFHLLGEVEVVFGLWAGVFILFYSFIAGSHPAVEYLESLNFTEPLFVFAIMSVAATRPVIAISRHLILMVAKLLPLPAGIAAYLVCMILGPLLGSFITEPAAMTVVAFVLRDLYFYDPKFLSARAKYVTLGLLLVNISIGGVLTNFAAPPVLMVASTWGWGTDFMFMHYGWKAACAVTLNTIIATWLIRKELGRADLSVHTAAALPVPLWLVFIHLAFLGLIVLNAHHTVVFIGLMLFFLGVTAITKEYQDAIKLREALLVAFFLGGLVVLGGPQRWWLEPILSTLGDTALYFGTTGLTAITDNAALTYLGAQVPGLSDSAKYALVAGAVTGGGLTVIANAPNPIAFSVLQETFGEDGISPMKLLVSALVPTLVAIIFFWFMPL